METFDKRVDAYIEKSADFAKPILNHLRALIHKASPEINETIKWSFPVFDHKGTVCHFASFKQHCAFGFWKGSLLPDPENILEDHRDSAMSQFGRITSIKDLPSDEILIQYIRNAVVLNETGVKLLAKKKTTAAEVEVPEYFSGQLSTNPLARSTFENFSNSHKKEYLEWLAEAKTEATRQKRMETAIEWLGEGKSRNWKYNKKVNA
jgi:uncharacterized protein YdeI (YjbR/CyaY-like superfamily)